MVAYFLSEISNSNVFVELFDSLIFDTIANDVPGGNQIRIINIKVQQSAFSKAIKTRFK